MEMENINKSREVQSVFTFMQRVKELDREASDKEMERARDRKPDRRFLFLELGCGADCYQTTFFTDLDRAIRYLIASDQDQGWGLLLHYKTGEILGATTIARLGVICLSRGGRDDDGE